MYAQIVEFEGSKSNETIYGLSFGKYFMIFYILINRKSVLAPLGPGFCVFMAPTLRNTPPYEYEFFINFLVEFFFCGRFIQGVLVLPMQLLKSDESR